MPPPDPEVLRIEANISSLSRDFNTSFMFQSLINKYKQRGGALVLIWAINRDQPKNRGAVDLFWPSIIVPYMPEKAVILFSAKNATSLPKY